MPIYGHVWKSLSNGRFSCAKLGAVGELDKGEGDQMAVFCALCRLRIFPLLSVSLCSCFPMPLLCLFLIQTLLLLAQLLAYPADSVYRRFYLPEPVLITVKPSSRILSHHPAFYAEISSFLSRTTCTGLFRKIQIGPNLFWLDVFIFVWSRGFQSTISKKRSSLWRWWKMLQVSFPF